jgi:hypothetical protein
VNAFRQAQAYEFNALKQLPPLRQGLEAQFYFFLSLKINSS